MDVDYDSYAAMSPLRKNAIGPQLTPENRAEIVRTHLQRFLDAERQRLTVDQIAFVEESIAYIGPELWRQPRDEEEIERRAREREARAQALFSRDDFLRMHAGAFKNSGAMSNPIAVALVRSTATTANVPALLEALHDLSTLPADELRARRYEGEDAATLLGRAYDGMPAGEEFWSAAGDKDARLAALRAKGFVNARRLCAPDE